MKFYAKQNDYGLNVTRNSGVWTIARFNTKKERDNWIDNQNGESGNLTADKCTRLEAQYILSKNINDIAEHYEDYQTGSKQMFWHNLNGVDVADCL